MRHRPFSRKLRQFKRLSERAERMLRSGEFQVLSRKKQDRLIERLRKLFHALRRVYDPSLLKRIMAGAAFLIGFGWGNPANAQEFAPPQKNPFDLLLFRTSPPYTSFLANPHPTFGDLDDDGDPDLLAGGLVEEFHYFENTGTPSSPSFAPDSADPYGLAIPDSASELYYFPDLGDLDGDGDLDMIVSSPTGGQELHFLYYENTGNPSSPSFASPQENPFGLDTTSQYYNVFQVSDQEFVDIDDDGDLDLFASGFGYARLLFFENVGSATNPDFATPEADTFGLNAIPYVAPASYFSFADLDQDGDQDLMIENASSSSGEAFSYFENTGTPSDPDLSSSPLPDPFQLTRSKDMLYGGPFVDIDDDGDQDLFVGSYYDSLTVTFYSLTFYENTMYTSIPSEKKESTNIQLYPQPAKERLRISIPDQGLKGPFSVMDMEGKLVMKGRSSEDRNPRKLDVSDLEPGLYLLRARTEEGILSRKFVVE